MNIQERARNLREQVEIAIKMLGVWEEKAENWKLESYKLAERMRILNDAEPPDIDFEKLQGPRFCISGDRKV